MRYLSLLACALWLAGAASAVPAPPAKPASLWRNLDDAHHLGGERFTDLDLDGMVVYMVRVKMNNVEKTLYEDVAKLRRSLDENARYNEIISVVGDKKEVEGYEAHRRKAKLRQLTAYHDFGLAKDEPAADSTPFYYVLNHKGEVAYAGPDRLKAKSALGKSMKAVPPADPFFGITPLTNEKLAAVTNLLAEGRTTMPAYAFLRKQAAGKDEAAAAEAAALVRALDQTENLRIAALTRLVKIAPGRTTLELAALGRMWPKSKSDERVEEIQRQLKKMPDAPKIAKIVAEVERLQKLEPQKASEAKTALASARAMLAKVQKMNKSKDEMKGPVAIEVGRLETPLLSLVEKLENWK